MTVEIAPDTDNLEDFEKLMYGHTQPVENVDVATDETPEVEDVKDDAEPDTAPVVDESEAEPEVEENLEPEPEPEKPKKSRYQERIDELVAERREAERKAEELERKLAELNKPKEEPKSEDKAPNPDALDAEGNPKYALGEFDPQYIRDLARYTIQEETRIAKEESLKEQQQREREVAQAALQESWTEKVAAAEDKYPDLQDKNQGLAEVFSDIDPAYGELLAAQIMSMDYGVDVLYHLGSNPAEAKKIVAMGPQGALVALGRLEARYSLQAEEKQERKLKVSAAPPPPERLNRGTSVAKDIPDDTDDLEAFERKFMAARRR